MTTSDGMPREQVMTKLDDAIEEAMLYSDLALSELSAESIRALISAARRLQELEKINYAEISD